MSDILIKGMEMPKEGFIEIVIHDNGNVQITGESICIDGADFYQPAQRFGEIIGKAIEIPEPHGRIIDADALSYRCGDWYTEEGTEEGFIGALKYLLEDVPTVIPATEEET